MSEENTEEIKPKRGRPPKVKKYRYTGKARIHTSIGCFVEGDIAEGLPDAEISDDWVSE